MYFYRYLYPQQLFLDGYPLPLSIRRNRSACQLKFESSNSPIANYIAGPQAVQYTSTYAWSDLSRVLRCNIRIDEDNPHLLYVGSDH